MKQCHEVFFVCFFQKIIIWTIPHNGLFWYLIVPTNKLHVNLAFMHAQSHRIQCSSHGDLVLATTRGVLSWCTTLLSPTVTGLLLLLSLVFILFVCLSLCMFLTHAHTHTHNVETSLLIYFPRVHGVPAWGVFTGCYLCQCWPLIPLSGFLRNAGTGWRSSKGGVTRERERQTDTGREWEREGERERVYIYIPKRLVLTGTTGLVDNWTLACCIFS